MGVPNTDTFSLQNVVDVVVPSSNNLEECFNDAVSNYFDYRYQGEKDRLSNFKNYGGEVETSKGYDHSNEGWMVILSDNSWPDARDAATADNLDTSTNDFEAYTEETNGTGDYEITRTYLSFDLSAIPFGSTCDNAVLGFRVTETYSGANGNPVAVESLYGPTITTSDFGTVTFNTIFLSVYEAADSGIWESILGYTHQLRVSGSGQKSNIAATFGGNLKLCIMNYTYDNGDTPPALNTKHGISIFKAGEVYTSPVLYVQFTI